MSSDSLYLPFSQHGFTWLWFRRKKRQVICNYFLKKNTTFEKIFIDTLVGDVSITVPKDFDGIYTLHTNNTGKFWGSTTNQTSNSVIEVDGIVR